MSSSNHISELINMMCGDIADDPDAYADACYQLWQLGDDAVDSLKPFLYEGNHSVEVSYSDILKNCLKSANILGNIGTDRAMNVLIKALKDEESILAEDVMGDVYMMSSEEELESHLRLDSIGTRMAIQRRLPRFSR